MAVELVLAGLAVFAGLMIGAVIYLFGPLLAISGVVGVAGLYVMFRNLDWAPAFLIFITWTNFSDVIIRFHGAPSVAKLLVPLIMALIIYRWMVNRQKPANWVPTAVLIGSYLFINALGWLHAPDFGRVTSEVVIVAKDALITVVIVMLIRDMKQFRRAVWAIAIGGLFLGSISVVQYASGNYANNYWGFGQSTEAGIIDGEVEGVRISGPIADPNGYAQFMLAVIPIAFALAVNEKRLLLRGIALASMITSVLTVVFTFSRGGFVGLAVVVLVLMILNPPRPSVIIAMIMAFIVVIQFLPPTYTERVATMTSFIPGFNNSSESVLEEGSFRGRMSHLFVGINMFADHPILGVGTNHFVYYYQDYSRVLGINTATREGRAAHNRWLEVAAEMGVIGLAVFLTIVWVILRNTWQARHVFLALGRRDDAGVAIGLGIGLIGYFVAATFLGDHFPRYFWVLVALAMALPNVIQYEVAARKDATTEPATVTD
jgi:O-antigen ligase